MASKYTMIIAEKPDAARRISEALADTPPCVSKKRGVPYYEFAVQGKSHICVPAAGHLFILAPSKENNPQGWDYPVFNLEWVPTYTKKVTFWTEKYFKNIQELSQDASEFIDAADVDAEGEVLLFNILRFICKVNDAKRMKFSTLTRDELRESYQTMEPNIFHSRLESGLTRHELDALWGLNLTRALTLALKNQKAIGFTLLSTGRVQGPTLSLLLKKERQIRTFKPTRFWQVVIKVKVGLIELPAIYEKEKLWDKSEAISILHSCKDHTATVIDIKIQSYAQNPPVPFNTTNLQSEAYRQFKYSPKQTLQIAESLYQKGTISYPRSSSQKLPPIINYKKILKAISTLKPYTLLVNQLLKTATLVPNQGKLIDPAHPAIYPTYEVSNLKNLNAYQKNLYDLIVRRFLSVFGNPALRESQNIFLNLNGYTFILKGTHTIDPGWTIFSGRYSSLEEQALPDLTIGQDLQIRDLRILSKETQPPPTI
jgi:DNA topoisomerase-1